MKLAVHGPSAYVYARNGEVELLTREGEIDIAKRIEDGINQVQNAAAEYPGTIPYILEQFDKVR